MLQSLLDKLGAMNVPTIMMMLNLCSLPQLQLIAYTATMPSNIHDCSKVISTLDLGVQHKKYSSQNHQFALGSLIHPALD